jgi:hypothetical protein
MAVVIIKIGAIILIANIDFSPPLSRARIRPPKRKRRKIMEYHGCLNIKSPNRDFTPKMCFFP